MTDDKPERGLPILIVDSEMDQQRRIVERALRANRDAVIALDELRAPPRPELPPIELIISPMLSTLSKSQRLPQQPIRTGRKAPCPCGSGRKFKKCCGRSAP
jgi:hypothetical protein